MNNLDETIKKILLNMNYDSKKTLSENFIYTNKTIILEQLKPSPGEIGVLNSMTIFQIMSFQYWVWNKVDKNPDTTPKISGQYNETKYNSILCSEKCASVKFDIPGNSVIEIPGAIDGSLGELTKKAWLKWGGTYQKDYPNWSKPIPDDKFYLWALGKTQPLSSMQEIKNFQKWFLEEFEKQKPDNNGLVKSILCLPASSCTVSKAIDGSWGIGTKNAWYYNGAGTQYKTKANVQDWYKPQEWSVEIQKQKDLAIKRFNEANEKARVLSNLETFYVNPSGWNSISVRDSNNPRYENTNGEYWKNNRNDALYYRLDWGYNTSVYPEPKPYSNQKIDEVFTILSEGYVRGDDGKWYTPEEFKKMGFLNKAEKPIESSTTYVKNEFKSKDPFYIEPSVISSAKDIQKRMKQFNKDLEDQKSLIPRYCQPVFTTDNVKTVDGSLAHMKWISPSEICVEAGGLWVYQEGNQMRCGCRDQSAPNINYQSIVKTNFLDRETNTTISVSHTLQPGKEILGFQTETIKPFDNTNIKDWAQLATDMTMPLTFATIFILPYLGASTITVEAVTMAFDIVDAASYFILDNDYAVGLSLTSAIIGSPNIIKKIPAISKFTDGSAVTYKKFIKDFSNALVTNKGLEKFTDVMKGIKENATWLQKTFLELLPSKTKKVAQYATNLAKKSISISAKIAKMTPKAFSKMIMYFITTEKMPISFLRNLLINFPLPILSWDYMAYYLGICNTMDMSQVQKMYDEAVKIETTKSYLNLSEKDKEILESKPWKSFLIFANTMKELQKFSNPCEKLEALDKMKTYQENNFGEILKNLNNIKGSWNFKIVEILKNPNNLNFDNYITEKPFDPIIYAIQCILIKFLEDNPNLNIEPIVTFNNYSNAQYGDLDGNTIEAINKFSIYSGIKTNNFTADKNTKTISQNLIDKLIKYVQSSPEELPNPSQIEYGNKEKEETYIKEIFEESQKINLIFPKPKVKETLEESLEKMKPDEKIKILDIIEDKDLEEYFNRIGN